MKKPTLTKLAVRRETLRALSSIELARAAGGDDRDTGAAMCPLSVASSAATCLVQTAFK